MTRPLTTQDLPWRPVHAGGTLLDDISLPATVATSPDVLNASLARRLRAQRARESDLVYEAGGWRSAAAARPLGSASTTSVIEMR